MSKTINVSPQMYKAIKNANEAGAYFQEQVGKFSDLIVGADEAQAKIDGLEAAYKEKQRIADLDLTLLVKANKQKAFDTLAKELGFVALRGNEYDELVHNSEEVTTKMEEAVKKEQARSAIALSSAVKNAKNEAALNLAQTEAQLTNAELRITFLKEQIEELRQDNAAIRATAESMVESATRSQVNVTNSGK